MRFTRTDYHQFMDQVYSLGKEKEFRFQFFINRHFRIFSLPNYVDDKRKKYNHALTNLLRKYGIVTDSFYGELNKIWRSEEEILRQRYEKAKNPDSWWKRVCDYGFPTGKCQSDADLAVLFRMDAWNNYKKRSLELCREIGKRALKGGKRA